MQISAKFFPSTAIMQELELVNQGKQSAAPILKSGAAAEEDPAMR